MVYIEKVCFECCKINHDNWLQMKIASKIKSILNKKYIPLS
jgi:hypothetical protein